MNRIFLPKGCEIDDEKIVTPAKDSPHPFIWHTLPVPVEMMSDIEAFERLMVNRPGIFKLYEARMLQKEIAKIIEDNSDE